MLRFHVFCPLFRLCAKTNYFLSLAIFPRNMTWISRSELTYSFQFSQWASSLLVRFLSPITIIFICYCAAKIVICTGRNIIHFPSLTMLVVRSKKPLQILKRLGPEFSNVPKRLNPLLLLSKRSWALDCDWNVYNVDFSLVTLTIKVSAY